MRKNYYKDMREFVLKASKAYTKPFTLKNLAGAGRMDLVCRCIINALWLSHALRRDVIFHAVLEGPNKPPKMVSFDGRYLKGISPHERNVASHIRIALEKGYELRKGEELIVSPGIKITKLSFEEIVKRKAAEAQLIYLHPNGIDIKNFNFRENVCFVLGDHVGLPKATEKLLRRIGAKKVSLGGIEYLASHCITICNYELDRRATKI